MINNTTVKLYKTPFNVERNSWVENLGQTLIPFISFISEEFQYVKHQLRISIKVRLSQSSRFKGIGNYCSIQNPDDDVPRYYFIISEEWESTQCVNLGLIMDAVNSYLYKPNINPFDERTSIIREHLDRYEKDSAGGLLRKINRTPENIPAKLFKRSDTKIYDLLKTKYYLIYRTSKDLDPKNISNPVNCFLLADKSLLLERGGGRGVPYTFTLDNATMDLYYYITAEDSPNAEITCDGQTFKFDNNHKVFWFKKYNDGVRIQFARGYLYYQVDGQYLNYSRPQSDFHSFNTNIVLNNVKTVFKSINQVTSYTDVNSITTKETIMAGEISDKRTIPFSELDRTDNRIVKIIKLPFAPTRFETGPIDKDVIIYNKDIWEFSEGMLRLKDLNSSFFNDECGSYSLNELFPDIPSLSTTLTKSIDYESKLFHSDYYIKKMVYGVDSYFFKLESFKNIPSNTAPFYLKIGFKVTNTLNSKFLFKFDFKNYDGYESETDYPQYFTISRNNEVTIFNNDYVNYIKNGFNYDKEKLERDNFARWGGTSLQIAGAVISGVVGVATGNPISAAAAVGMGISAVNSIAHNILSQQENERSLDQKLRELKNQRTNVIGADDIDLMDEYCDNTTHIMIYQPSDRMRELLFDLFYYCGYSNPIQHSPDLYSRYWFNYIQCDPIFTNEIETNTPKEILEELKARFQAGVTLYHYHSNVPNFTHDFNQVMENWEISIL